ncbi:MAG: hypothetical protein ACWGMZ_08685, partial [Thermoguttaceae bacterium]
MIFDFRFIVFLLFCVAIDLPVFSADLTVELAGSQNVAFVGAIQRWDRNGNQRRLPDPKAKINAPVVDATAKKIGKNKWLFADLSPGTYDLIILAKNRIRIEGFQFVPVKEFDPVISPDSAVEIETRDCIIEHIKKSPRYENKVVSLYLAGDKKSVRVLMMLIRDKPTSYERQNLGAATVRHEIWQYSWNYGGWQKEKRTKVLDRVMLHRDQLRKWTWLWDAKLGGITVQDKPLNIEYDVSSTSTAKLKGL